VPVAAMHPIDRWALGQTAELIRGCTEAYDAYEFHQVYQLCNHFCSVTLSATYHDILKDRLYTLGANDPLRRSSQTAIHHIFQTLTKLLAPILVFTADEAWAFATARTEYSDDSVHAQDWPVPPESWTDPELRSDLAVLLALRSRVNETIEPLRAAGQLGKSLDAAVTIAVFPDDPPGIVLQRRNQFLAEWFIVSRVDLAPTDSKSDAMAISVRPAQETNPCRCPRCWRWVPALEPSGHGDVCSRCVEALAS